MCSLHVARFYRGFPLDAPIRKGTRPVPICRLCDKPAHAKGLCQGHWLRIIRGKDAEGPLQVRGRSDRERAEILLAKAVPEGDCLVAARLSASGYPVMVKGEAKRAVQMYRLIFTAMNGPIPRGDQIHHACANRGCIRPEHLVLATHSENTAEMHARTSYERRIAALEAENLYLREQLAAHLVKENP